MALPGHHEMFLPVLQALSDGKAIRRPELCNRVAASLELTSEEVAEKTKGGKSRLYDVCDRAQQYLLEAGLVNRPKWAHYEIAPAGLQMLRLQDSLTLADLEAMPKFAHWRKFGRRKT